MLNLFVPKCSVEDISSPFVIEIGEPNATGDLRQVNSFMAPTLLSKWKAVRRRVDRVSAAILLPSGGYVLKGGIKMEIENERTVKIAVVWPEVFHDGDLLLELFLKGDGVEKLDRSHPMVGGFEDSIQAIQKKVTS